jgi:uncharacterized protein YbaR (Trm112 family)
MEVPVEILACPKCKKPIKLDGSKIVCGQCNEWYPIENDIPILLAGEAKPC